MAKFKELKVGDEVRLEYLNGSHHLYISDLETFVGCKGKIVGTDSSDKTVRIHFAEGHFGYWYKPKWLSLVVGVSKETPEVKPNYTEMKLWGDKVIITWEGEHGKDAPGLVLCGGEEVYISNSDGAEVSFWKEDLVKLHQAVTEALEIIGKEGKGK